MRGFAFRVCMCVVMIVPLAAAATDSDKQAAQQLSAYVDAFATNGDLSGVVLVTRGGKRVFEREVGVSSLSSKRRIRSNTKFVVASVTKTFTAAGIALLQNDGKIKIEDGLDDYLPYFAPASRIKIWHLLGHQSGLDNPDYDSIATRAVAPDELLAMIAAKPLLFEPGSSSRYSNAGYITLARVIEKASRQSFDEYLQQRIFGPLGMKRSGTLSSGETVPDLAEGYMPGVGTEILPTAPRDPSSLYGSGNVYSTASDLDRWLTAIDTNQLFDIGKQPYPFGWGKRDWFGKNVLVQSGMTNGYCSVILTVPAEALHIVVLTNLQSGFTSDEGKTLLGILAGQPATPPAPRAAPAIVDGATLETYAGLYQWGESKVPMHLETDGRVLTLRWADSASVTPLTPLSTTEFLDRTSFGVIRFVEGGLEWIQNGETTRAPRSNS